MDLSNGLLAFIRDFAIATEPSQWGTFSPVGLIVAFECSAKRQKVDVDGRCLTIRGCYHCEREVDCRDDFKCGIPEIFSLPFAGTVFCKFFLHYVAS